ncbi:hypothetical protein QYS49_36560 [Marivirga salinae]|uniref:Uncharacterized protein n=1 Tax=Marivirga salinarum TaxID=3059078 RepID=A0AA51N994_9BACT|nr:hypothetical protein [Marivirga sp. BDSF4-3]WMN10933.1 hypothetical protein QYS49_36560 [Marivirga sp. BDSF4-3]
MMRKLFLFFISLLILAVLLVPSQSDYFQRLENDYRNTHHANLLNKELLRKVGEFEYRNRLLFSQFDYSFGNISVSYYGFLDIIFFKSSTIKEQESPEITV